MRQSILAVLAACLVLGGPRARAAGAMSVTSLLDAYLHGRFDEAIAGAAGYRDAGDFAETLMRQAPRWIEADGPAETRRLAVAAFALEYTHARMETDWRTVEPLLEWACQAFSHAGAPSEGERRWHLGVIAVAGRARDFGRLGLVLAQRGPLPREAIEVQATRFSRAGHLAHVLERFPGEPRALLAYAVASIARVDEEPTRNPSGFASAVFQAQRNDQLDAI